jgi:hypothetical protein
MAIMLAASAVAAAPSVLSQARPASRVARVAPPTRRALETTSAAQAEAAEPRAAGLGFVEVKNRNTEASGKILLYGEDGTLDRGAARSFMRIAGRTKTAPDDAGEDDERLDLRLVQLAIRASYHFDGAPISIISATRARTRGKHGTGEALDFALVGVKASLLAAYLRTTPRAGVGIYTHPKTQYVHLDVREASYHWIDASPPGVTWRERLLSDPNRAMRDASWSASLDLPEALR